jgi:hypothetical protein
MRFGTALPAYRGPAVLLELPDVLVAAAQPVLRLVGRCRRVTGFNAYGADGDGGAPVELGARGMARR